MQKPWTGITAFLIVLFTMPLGHAAMILMEKGFGHKYIYPAAMVLGLLGMMIMIAGAFSSKETKATFSGLAGGLLVWTGWIEFAFVYFANRYNVAPLMHNGEIVTKPEYLIMPSSVGFWAVFMAYFLFGTSSGCKFFSWWQKKLKIKTGIRKNSTKNPAIITFTETIFLLWTFYLVLLFSYDSNFIGDRHPVTYIIAFASLFWSAILFRKLIKIQKTAYAIRYSIPTVIIFWNFVEILGRWDIFHEIWVQPDKYWLEMLLTCLVFISLIILSLGNKNALKKKANI